MREQPPVHWVVRVNHRMRTLFFLALLLAISTHLWSQASSWSLWGALLLTFIVYPQLAYWRARRHPDSRTTELDNLVIDAFLLGGWIAALGAPVWISYALAMGCLLNLLVYRGPLGLAQALSGLVLGGVLVWGLFRPEYRPTTGPWTTALSLAIVSSYLLLVTHIAFKRNVEQNDLRQTLRENEQLLRQQLKEIHTLQAQLEDQANRDPLTGVFNRRYLETRLLQSFDDFHAGAPRASVLLLDVDRFKAMNDSLGHPAGDALLMRLAQILQELSSADGVVCRYGGDEFLVLLPGTTVDQALQIAQQARTRFTESCADMIGAPRACSVSIGAAHFEATDSNARQVIARADHALYRAKDAGRDRVSA